MTDERCYNRCSRGVAQPGSAPALGAGGRAFKSPRPDQQNKAVPLLGPTRISPCTRGCTRQSTIAPSLMPGRLAVLPGYRIGSLPQLFASQPFERGCNAPASLDPY